MQRTIHTRTGCQRRVWAGVAPYRAARVGRRDTALLTYRRHVPLPRESWISSEKTQRVIAKRGRRSARRILGLQPRRQCHPRVRCHCPGPFWAVGNRGLAPHFPPFG